MSTLSLLSKEQGVTVIGVCAAFDVFLNWEHIKSGSVSKQMMTVKSGEQTPVSEINSHQTVRRLTRASMDSSCVTSVVSHVNGMSSIVAKRSGSTRNSGPDIQMHVASRLGER